MGFPFHSIVKQRRVMRGHLTSLKDIRDLWIDDPTKTQRERKINKMIRIMSYKFLREELIPMIFSS